MKVFLEGLGCCERKGKERASRLPVVQQDGYDWCPL